MMSKAFGFCLATALLAAVPVMAQPAAAPWMNTALTPDQRADLIAAQMTQNEKFVLIDGWFGVDAPINPNYPPPPADIRKALPGSAGYVPGIPRLGIPAQYETDASLGVANGGHMRPGDTATALPASILTASTWDPKMAYAVGSVLGKETRDKGFNVLLNGGVDLARDPRNGRNFEYTGEDPLLAGTITGEAIKGAQDQHIISTAKHYAVNDQEIGRNWLSSNLSEQAMRESDLLAFEIAIEKGQPGSIMCAYNRVNGVYSCENAFLLNKVLKGDWHYPGYVMSDWGGVHSTVDAAINGLDQESAFVFDRENFFGDKLKQAVADGKVPQARIDDMVHRILRSMFANGLFDHPLVKKPLDEKADLAVAQRDAEDGIVLLKNTGNLLPLAAKTKRIAVIGGRADVGVLSGGGSSQVIPLGDDPAKQEFLIGGPVAADHGPHLSFDSVVYDTPSPLAALRAETKAKVTYDDGVDPTKAAALARTSDIAIVFVEVRQGEGWDLPTIALPDWQNALIAAVAKANPHTVVVLETGNPVAMPWLADVGAVVEAWYPGNRGAAALARVLSGKVNPSGRLPITFPQSDAQLPRPVIPGQDFRQPQDGWSGGATSFDVNYSEGANVGYKWYATQKLQPLFPFGYGLSYTTFGFDGLTAASTPALTVGFDMHNTGKRAGKAVGQVYATPPGGVTRLVGFAKVELKPGQSKHVTVTVDPRLLASFDTAAQMWRVAAGDYVLSLGASSADVRATTTVHLDESTIKP